MSKGTEAEVLFDYMATQKGLNVSRPLSDCSYDRIVDSGGKLTRVQIKMTAVEDIKSKVWVQTSGVKKRSYVGHVDVIAIYIKQNNSWFIIPMGDIPGTAINFNINGKYVKYLEKWDVLF